MRQAGYRLVVAVAMTLLLAGCLPTRKPPAPVTVTHPDELTEHARQAEAARTQWLQARPGWSFQGRAAISTGRQGGNAKIDWQQRDNRNYVVELIAPVTRQTWRLTGNTHYEAGRLEGMPGGPRDGEQADVLLREATGWDIPLERLPEWVRGMVAHEAPMPDSISYDTEGRPYRIEQAGWVVEFQDWYSADATRPALPRRLQARDEAIDAKVRLLIDQWSFQDPDPAAHEHE